MIETGTLFCLTLIVLGGKSNLIVWGGGQICPEDFFGVFIIKFNSKTNIMPILWFLDYLNEYFDYIGIKKIQLDFIGGGADLPRAGLSNVFKSYQ